MPSDSIYVLCADAGHEGLDPLMGFQSPDAAYGMKHLATVHEEKRPLPPADDNVSGWQWYDTLYELWRREHPLGNRVNISGHGRYEVVQLPFKGSNDD